MANTVSTQGLVEIASHEGIVPMPYFDSVGVLTFGIGHTRFAGPPDPADLPRGIAQPLEMVFDLFREDIVRFSRQVDAAVTVPVEQHEFDALVSFHYNTGGIRRASLTRALNAGNREDAANRFMRWRKPPEIIGRRRREQSLFRDGTYTSGGFATVLRATEAGRVLWSSGKRVNVMELLGEDQVDRPITAVLRPGSIGADVRRLQKALSIVADGSFGPMTKAAVMDYQERHGLIVDGIAGPQTLGHLGLA